MKSNTSMLKKGRISLIIFQLARLSVARDTCKSDLWGMSTFVSGLKEEGTCFWALVNTLQWEDSQIMSILGKLGTHTKSWNDPNGESDSSLNSVWWPQTHSPASLSLIFCLMLNKEVFCTEIHYNVTVSLSNDAHMNNWGTNNNQWITTAHSLWRNFTSGGSFFFISRGYVYCDYV